MSNTYSYDVFVSYNSRDHDTVQVVAQWLRDQKLTVFLDRWYLAAGKPWPEALEEALSACRAVAVFLGPGTMGAWQQREKHLALDRQAHDDGRLPVIPVLLPPAEPVLGFLGLNTWIDLRSGVDDPVKLGGLLAAIRGEPPGPAFDAAHTGVCPYRGLQVFREEDSLFFFGREAASDLLVETITRRNLVAVVGASGSGKSSVVRAGLLPRLRGSRHVVWEAAAFVPGDRPFYGLAAALTPLTSRGPRRPALAGVADALRLAGRRCDRRPQRRLSPRFARRERRWRPLASPRYR